MDADKKRKWLLTAAKLAIVALLIWFVRKSLESAFESLTEHDKWSLRPDWPAWLVLSGVIYLIAVLPQVLFGKRLFAEVGYPITTAEAVRASYLAQLGKYVPGKAMVLILRAGLLARAQVPPTLVTAVVFAETLTAMASGSLVSILCLLISPPKEFIQAMLAAVFMLFATGLPLLPPVFKLVVRVLHITKLNVETVRKLLHVRARVLVGGWLSIGLFWFVNGLMLWATLVALGKADLNPLVNLPLHTAAVALSVVGGFLALIPGGLIVREGLLVLILKDTYGDETSVIAAVLLRLVQLAAELLSSVCLYALRPAAASTATETVPDTTQAE